MTDQEREPMTAVSPDEDRTPELSEKDKKTKNKKGKPQPEPEESEPEGKCTCNLSFFLSLEGMLKLIEFVTTLISWIICAIGYDRLKAQTISRYGFFLFVAISCWIFTIVVICVHLFGLYNRYINNRLSRLFAWYINLLAFSAIYAFFWIFGAILLTLHYRRWGGNAAAGFFGFINLILFIVDVVLYFKVCRKYRKEIKKIHRGGYEDPNAV